jgi:hypothetical protein
MATLKDAIETGHHGPAVLPVVRDGAALPVRTGNPGGHPAQGVVRDRADDPGRQGGNRADEQGRQR